MKLKPKSKGSLVLFALIFLVLMLLANSRVHTATQHSREAVLKTDLRAIRDAIDIDKYTLDKGEAPRSLLDLVEAGYLRSIPTDPITLKPDVPDFGVPVLGDPVLSPELKAEGLVDVHSSSNRVSRDGSKYS